MFSFVILGMTCQYGIMGYLVYLLEVLIWSILICLVLMLKWFFFFLVGGGAGGV